MDNFDDEEKFKSDLKNIALTTLSSKLLKSERDHFAELAVQSVLRLKGSGNMDYIKIIKKAGGTLSDSYLADGFILGHSINRALNGIFQFSDIARPGVLLQGLLGLWAEARENRALQFLGHGDREVFGKQ